MMRFELLGALPKALTSRDLKKIEGVLSDQIRSKRSMIASLSFVSEAKMQTLNRQAMRKNRPTDVLSFPAAQIGQPVDHDYMLGDIVICPTYAAREAKRRSLPLKEELSRLLIHGVLHLRGMDHDTQPKELKMFGLQERLLEKAFG